MNLIKIANNLNISRTEYNLSKMERLWNEIEKDFNENGPHTASKTLLNYDLKLTSDEYDILHHALISLILKK